MEKIASDADGVTLCLTGEEAMILRGSLFCLGVYFSGDEFEDRFGRSGDQAKQLQDAIDIARDDWAGTPWMNPSRPVDPEGFELHLAHLDLRLIRDALARVTDDEWMGEGEFHTLTGTRQDEARQLLVEFEALLIN